MKIALISTDPYVTGSIIKSSKEYKNKYFISMKVFTELDHFINEGFKIDKIIWLISKKDQWNIRLMSYFLKKYARIHTLVLLKDVSIKKEIYNLDHVSVCDVARLDQSFYQCIKFFIQEETDSVSSLKSSTLEIFPGLYFKPELRCLIHEDQSFFLPNKEFELLVFFLNNMDEFVTMDQILLAVWDKYTSPETVRQYIYKLRRKLDRMTAPLRMLLHIKGAGYILVRKENIFLTKN